MIKFETRSSDNPTNHDITQLQRKKFMTPVSFATVLKVLKSQRSRRHSRTSGWTGKAIRFADKTSGGEWFQMIVEVDDLLGGVLLPRHTHGRLELVPEGGLTPAEAAARLVHFGDRYWRDCDVCFEKIYALTCMEPTPVFLSAVSMNECEHSFQNIVFDGTKTIVIDGLHRLVSWALNRKNGLRMKAVPVFIAGHISCCFPSASRPRCGEIPPDVAGR